MPVQTDTAARRPGAERTQPQFSQNAETVLKKRYLIKNDQGEPIETPAEMVWRVAANVAQGELNFPSGESYYEEMCERFFQIIANCEFMPNSPTLMNAGKGHPQQLSACFVIPVDDAIDSIFDAVKHAAIIHKTGGGTGFAFSRLRPKNDRVRSTKGVSSGPVSFMKVFNAATEAIKQGGTRRGANMGILRVDHPDIIEFVNCKADMTSVTNFNISVALTETFMEAVLADQEYELINPKNHHVVGCLKAREVFDQIVDNAWKNGDPGIVFIDRINKDNPTPAVGPMESTNPCGEQPLLPYEACNLGSVNLAKMVKKVQVCEEASGAGSRSGSCEFSSDGFTSRNLLNDGTCWIIDWDKLAETVHLCIRFLDDVIEMSDFPLQSITNIVKIGNRKIGLGVMGFADLLFMLGVPYTSREAADLGERLMAFIQKHAAEASEDLAKERGSFGNFPNSVFGDQQHPWHNGGRARRNATVTTIAPTGTISILANCSSGIEPLFAICFYRRVLDGAELIEVHPFFEQVARARGFHSEALMKEIALRGSIQEIDEIPEDVRRVFVTSHDISPAWHLEHQAAFQRHCENAVSKTVNFPHTATREDVAEVYKLAYLKGCKGVTIYRDGSRDVQVLNVGLGAKKNDAEPQKAPKGDSQQVAAGNNTHDTAAAKRARALTLSAGGTKVTLNSDALITGDNGDNTLLRRFNAHVDKSKLQRLALDSKLFIGDGNGFRVPLQLVSQEGSAQKGIQLVIEAGSTAAGASTMTTPRCPECNMPLIMEEGCRKCRNGCYSKCG
jgi:ribonucleoside-diphosphate reductase alpha chain